MTKEYAIIPSKRDAAAGESGSRSSLSAFRVSGDESGQVALKTDKVASLVLAIWVAPRLSVPFGRGSFFILVNLKRGI